MASAAQVIAKGAELAHQIRAQTELMRRLAHLSHQSEQGLQRGLCAHAPLHGLRH